MITTTDMNKICMMLDRTTDIVKNNTFKDDQYKLIEPFLIKLTKELYRKDPDAMAE